MFGLTLGFVFPLWLFKRSASKAREKLVSLHELTGTLLLLSGRVGLHTLRTCWHRNCCWCFQSVSFSCPSERVLIFFLEMLSLPVFILGAVNALKCSR